MDYLILFKEREIIIHQVSYKKRQMLKNLSGGSFGNPVPRSLFIEEEMRNGVNNNETAAKNRVNSNISNLRKFLEGYGLTIAVRESEFDHRTGGYYLDEKDSFIRKKKSTREVVAAKVHELRLSALNAKTESSKEEFSGNQILPKGDVFVAEKDEKKDETVSRESDREGSDSEFLIPCGFKEFTFPEPKEKLDPKFLLTEDEICIIAVSFLKRGEDLKVNTASIDVGEIGALLNRIGVRLEKNNQTRIDLERVSLLSAINKLREFQKNPEKYLRACDKKTRALLKCLDAVETTDDFLENLFPEPEQVKLIGEAKVKREV